MRERRNQIRVAKPEFARKPGAILEFSKGVYEVMPNGSYRKIEINE